MKYLFIGNKIQDLGGFTNNKLQASIKKIIDKKIASMDRIDDIVITSLSLGIETWAAEAAHKYNIPYKVYVPFNNYHSKWITSAKSNYINLVKFAKDAVAVSNGSYSLDSLKKCNNILISEADHIVSFYNEHVYAFKQAKDLKKTIENLMPTGEENDFHITL